MIKSLTVLNELGDMVKVTLADGEPDHGLLLINMDGLGPAKANINTSVLSTADGDRYNSARLDKRNITIQFKFTNDIETTRQFTYQMFPIKKPVDLVIETDNHTLTTTGYIETNEPNIFSDSEGCSISIICPDPYFYLLDVGDIEISISNGLFEFPYSSEIHYSTEWDRLYDSYPEDPSDRNVVLYKTTKQVREDVNDSNWFKVLDNSSDPIWEYREVDDYSPHYTPGGEVVVKPPYDQYLTAEVVEDHLLDSNGEEILDRDLDYISSIKVITYYKDPVIESYGISAILDSNGDPIEARVTTYQDGEMIEFSTVATDAYNSFYYYGTVRIGCVIKLYFSSAVSSDIVIYNDATNERMVIEAAKFYMLTQTYFQAGDEVTINTIANQKSVTLFRDGQYINIMHCIIKPIQWISVINGVNGFYFMTSETSKKDIDMNVYYQTAFEGI